MNGMLRVLYPTSVNSYGSVEECLIYEFDYKQLKSSVASVGAILETTDSLWADDRRGIINSMDVHDCFVMVNKPLQGWSRCWVCENGLPAREVIA
jgi:hypothetical protein